MKIKLFNNNLIVGKGEKNCTERKIMFDTKFKKKKKSTLFCITIAIRIHLTPFPIISAHLREI